jgi:hypothetical protein
MKKIFIFYFFISFLFVSCQQHPIRALTINSNENKDEQKDMDFIDFDISNENDLEFNDNNSLIDNDSYFNNDADKTENLDKDNYFTDEDIINFACKTDNECKKFKKDSSAICVFEKCQTGCKTNSDCKSFQGTVCNKKLGRCLNTIANNQACNEINCPKGCCYAINGFTKLKCLKNPKISTCGVCEQGKIFLDGMKCINAVCSISQDFCPKYNFFHYDSKCYKCEKKELVCKKDLNCSNTGSNSGFLINSQKCISSGQLCIPGQLCCSGQPCIQGFCY